MSALTNIIKEVSLKEEKDVPLTNGIRYLDFIQGNVNSLDS